MDVKKITISPVVHGLHKIVLDNPSYEVVNQRLAQITDSSEKLPMRILRKMAKERKIPDFVNLNSYVAKSYSNLEGVQALNGSKLNLYI